MYNLKSHSRTRVAPAAPDPKDDTIADLRRKVVNLKEEVKSKDYTILGLNERIEDLENSVVNLQGENADLNDEVTRKENTILDLDERIADLEKTVSKQNAKCTDLQNTLVAKESVIQFLREDVIRLESKIGHVGDADIAGLRQAMEAQSTIFASSIAKMTGNFTEATKKLRAYSAKLLTQKAEIETQKEEIADLRKTLNGLTENLEQEAKALACKMHDFKETENKGLRIVIDFTRNRLEYLQDVISSRTLMAPCPWCPNYYDITEYNFKALHCGCAPCNHCIEKELEKNKPNNPTVRCKGCNAYCSLHTSFRIVAK